MSIAMQCNPCIVSQLNAVQCLQRNGILFVLGRQTMHGDHLVCFWEKNVMRCTQLISLVSFLFRLHSFDRSHTPQATAVGRFGTGGSPRTTAEAYFYYHGTFQRPHSGVGRCQRSVGPRRYVTSSCTLILYGIGYKKSNTMRTNDTYKRCGIDTFN